MTKKLQQCNTNKSSKFIPLFKQGQQLRKRKESQTLRSIQLKNSLISFDPTSS